MKCLAVLLAMFGSLAAAAVYAQEPPFDLTDSAAPVRSPEPTYTSPTIAEDYSSSADVSWGQLQPTESMWLYEQERKQYLDPELAVRRKAERESANRQARIASRKWYGLSNSRPVANPTPFCGVYSPGWHANHYNSYRWTGVTHPLLVVNPGRPSVSATYGMW